MIHDFSDEVDNETLVFDDTGCDEILITNGSALLLKRNILSACVRF